MRRLLTSLLVGGALSAALWSPSGAAAVPDSGAGADTPGTTASVAPRALAPGQTLSFSLGGFPAGETVYLKIDDGQSCSAVSVHGACVVHQQRITGNGTVRGSFVLPRDLKPGRHWLRFLASSEVRDSSGAYQGIKGYTKRSPDFTVRAAGDTGNGSRTGTDAEQQTGAGNEPGAAPGTSAPGAAPDATPGAVAGAEPQVGTEGAPLVAPSMAPSGTAPATTPAAEPSDSSGNDGTTEANASDAVAESDPASFPYLGASGLALCLLAAAWIILRSRRVRSRA